MGHYFYLLNLSGFVMDTEGECETQRNIRDKNSLLFLFEVGYHLKQEEERIPPQTGRREDPTSNRKRGGSHNKQEEGRIPPQTGRGEDPTSNRKRKGSHLKQEEGRIPPQTGRGEDPTSNRKILTSFCSGGILPYFCLRWDPLIFLFWWASPLFLFVVDSSYLPVCGGLLLSSCL